MTKLKKLWRVATLCLVLGFSNSLAAQNPPITMQVYMLAGGNKLSAGAPATGQPAPGVSIYVLAGGNKFSAGTPPTGTTDTTGSFVFPPGLLSSSKPHTQMEVYEVCVNGQRVIFVIPKGAEDQLPPDTNDCKKRRLGAFWLDGGHNVVVNLGANGGGGGVTQTGQTTSTAQSHIPVWAQIAGGPGFKNFPNAFGGCTALSEAFPGGKCGSSNNSVAFDVDAAVHIWHVAARGGYWRANSVSLDASGSVLGGGTDTLHSSIQPEAGYLTGGFCIPLGNKISVIPDAGAAFWAANLRKLETVTTSAAPTTSRDSLHVTGVGPQAGAAVHVDVTSRLGFEVRYAYVQMNNKPAINEHNNLFFFNLTFKLFGK